MVIQRLEAYHSSKIVSPKHVSVCFCVTVTTRTSAVTFSGSNNGAPVQTKNISASQLSSSPAIINLNNTLQMCMEGNSGKGGDSEPGNYSLRYNFP